MIVRDETCGHKASTWLLADAACAAFSTEPFPPRLAQTLKHFKKGGKALETNASLYASTSINAKLGYPAFANVLERPFLYLFRINTFGINGYR